MTEKTIKTTEILEAVSSRYGAIAERFEPNAQASCCGPDDVVLGADTLYDVSLLADLPADVTGLSLGCGDPVTLASLEVGQTVLDLGSGAGIDVFIAARQVGPQGRVIGVDMTDEMLAKARANKFQLGEAARKVEFRKGYIEALPVEDNSIDVVVSNCVINLSPDKAQVFREAFRVLKPGGRLTISDIVIEGQFSEEARADADSWAACVSGAIDAQEYVDAIKAAGFVDIHIADKNPVGDDVLPLEVLNSGPRIYSARVTARKS